MRAGEVSEGVARLGGVLREIDLRGSRRDPRGLLPRAQLDVSVAVEKIRPVVEGVREHGFSAIVSATEQFDGVRLERLRVPAEVIAEAAEALDDDVRAALLEIIARARKVHADQRRTDTTTQVVPGGSVTERWVPVARVGLYVPGGLAVYPSTVVMNVVPAQEAGVESLVVASPPQTENDGLPDARVLAACALLGVDEVYAVGGAQAIAMLGYGSDGADESDRCEPVDVITGPGNIWVTAAKRLLRGTVGIDAEAGPDRDRHPGRRHRRPGARRRRPDQPGRARPAGRVRAGHRLAGAGRRGRDRAGPAGAGHQARGPGPRGADRRAVRRGAGRRPRAGAAGGGRLRGRAPGDPDPRRPRVGDAGPQRRRDLRRRLVAGVARRLRGRVQPRAADRRLRPALVRAVRAVVPARHPRRGVRPGRRCATSPATSSPWPTPRICRRTARP